jgi:hypothetical protein
MTKTWGSYLDERALPLLWTVMAIAGVGRLLLVFALLPISTYFCS